jgi:hypothetical protein
MDRLHIRLDKQFRMVCTYHDNIKAHLITGLAINRMQPQ